MSAAGNSTQSERRVIFAPDGANIEYTVCGTGPKVLVVHGIQLVQSEHADFCRIISKHVTVFDLQRRGWGGSSAKGHSYSAAQEAGDIALVMEKEGVRQLCGQGYGALLALDAAVRSGADKLMLDGPVLQSELGSLEWLGRFERERLSGDYLAAMATFTKHTSSAAKNVPSPILKFAFKRTSIDRDKQVIANTIECDDQDLDAARKADIESQSWKQLKAMADNAAPELEAMQEAEPAFSQAISLDASVLIHSDDGDEDYVKRSCERLGQVIPGSTQYRTHFGKHATNGQLQDYFKQLWNFFGGD